MTTSANKPVIFLAFANDRDDHVDYLRNLPEETRRLRSVLERAEQAGLCEVVVRTNCTADDIFRVFQDAKYRNRIAIFHYGGHANGYQLLLESADGRTATASAGALAAFLGQQQGLQLVFLNGCATQGQTQALLEANVSTVISTSRAIDDLVATDFSNRFYQGLVGGATIRTAFKESEASIQTVKGANTRALYYGQQRKSTVAIDEDRVPWNLYTREGSEELAQWNLPQAANDPLFGLPAVPAIDLPESPFRHLNRYTESTAEVFYGRGHQIREMYDRLTATGTAPIILFYGQSGVGKSSLLDAGVLPRLKRDHDVVYLRRGADGLVETLRSAFSSDPGNGSIKSAWLAQEQLRQKPLVIFLDQIEEVYTRPLTQHPRELDDLLAVVKEVFGDSRQRPHGRLVLAFRKEWLADIESRLKDHELSRTKVFLERLDRRGILEAVLGPTRTQRLQHHYGLTIEAGLPEIIADDLNEDRDSALAPTLQILLAKMWAKAVAVNPAQPHFSRDLYQQLRREGVLLDDFLTQQFSAIHSEQPHTVESGLLLDFLAWHTTTLGTADQRSLAMLQQQYPHLLSDLPKLLRSCQDRYLITVATGASSDSQTMRLAHDTLAPLVRRRFEESDLPGQRALRVLENKVNDRDGVATDNRLDETDLNIVEKGRLGMRSWSKAELQLIEASRATLKRNRLLRWVTIALLAIISLLGLAFWRSAELASREQAKTEQEKFTRQISQHMESGITERDRTNNVPKAIHHFLRAESLARQKAGNSRTKEEHDQETIVDARMAAMLLLRGATLSGIFDMETELNGKWPIGGATLNETGTRLVAWTFMPTVIRSAPDIRVFDTLTGESVAPRLYLSKDSRFPTRIESVSVSPDGTRVLARDLAGNSRLWDVTKGPNDAPVLAQFPENENAQVAFGQDGKTLFVAKPNEWMILDSNTGRVQHSAPFSGEILTEWQPTPDGQHLLGWTDQAFYRWPISSEPPALIYQPNLTFNVLWVSEDHRQVIVLDSDNRIHQIDPISKQISALSFGDVPLENAAISDDRGYLIVTNSNGESTIMSLTDHSQRILIGSSETQSVSMHGLNQPILTRNQPPDGRIVRWRPDPASEYPQHLGVCQIHPNASVQRSRDGRRLAAWHKNQLQVWDIATGEPLTSPLFHEAKIEQAIFSRDSNHVLSWSNGDALVKLWTLESRSPYVAREREPGSVVDLSNILTAEQVAAAVPSLKSDRLEGGTLSPDGSRIVTWGIEGPARLWDAKNGEPLAPAMQLEVEVGGDMRVVAVGGAVFDADSKRVLTWSSELPLRSYEPVYPVSKYLRVWSGRTGQPLTPKIGQVHWIEKAEFTGENSVMAVSDTSLFEWSLSTPSELSIEDQIRDAEIRTGTRFTNLEEFEFLSAQEWQERRDRGKSGLEP
ncbi:MAG: CHAT domain-containing protein [Planctomycetaceae bacterium]|nr:CHAT domain-containing protein [Planctomycetaceae bacterium]